MKLIFDQEALLHGILLCGLFAWYKVVEVSPFDESLVSLVNLLLEFPLVLWDVRSFVKRRISEVFAQVA